MNMRKIFAAFTCICMFGAFLCGGCAKEDAGIPDAEKLQTTETPPPTPSPRPSPTPAAETPEPEPDLTGLLLDITVEAGTAELAPSDFLQEGYEDRELTIVSHLSAEDLRTPSIYLVTLQLDHCNVAAQVQVVDTTPPVFEGLKSITVNRGDSISYKKGVAVTDNSSEEISFDVDHSAVDANVCGAYTVSYTASDSSGNTAKEWVTVTVLEPTAVINESTVLPMLDNIIASVVKPDMTKYDQAYQLWKWLGANIKYSTSSEYPDYWESINGGLTTKKGDCYVYYAIYSALLTQCGIDNLCVRRTNGLTDHYWNLVNVGDGWYHCDSSPRPAGDSYKCFMQTDEQLAAYTAAFAVHGSPAYYTFDPDQYPERNPKIIFPNDIPKVE